jgi:hypothetical protein
MKAPGMNQSTVPLRSTASNHDHQGARISSIHYRRAVAPRRLSILARQIYAPSPTDVRSRSVRFPGQPVVEFDFPAHNYHQTIQASSEEEKEARVAARHVAADCPWFTKSNYRQMLLDHRFDPMTLSRALLLQEGQGYRSDCNKLKKQRRAAVAQHVLRVVG